ncbi:excalibur calcium-binding domain-containing protein [Luteimonas sp. TWI662]|uniref:excalibur calcium-binding domain-containing protein n=1 Tax=Luteimonas sp. TWI662 TaxID=3136789 RepID=UPI003209FA34
MLRTCPTPSEGQTMHKRAGLALLFAAAATVQAHPGGLNAEGCHNNRKTGDYHCHRSPSAPAPQRLAPSTVEPATGWSYRNCTEARQASAAPVRRGEPGYGPHLDRDGDGIGCE